MRECIFFLCLWCGIIGGAEAVSPGIQHFDRYRSLLEGKKVGIVANQTAVLETGDGYKHSVDFLRDHQVQLIRIFCPEHGFRGDADAGETVGDYRDRQTGLPVISLYGKKKKPSPADLQGLDVVVFDMQDVGVRFYTYLSTLHYVMEFPRAKIADGPYDFSFSGLKSAVLNYLNGCQMKGISIVQADVAASFQKAVTDVLIGNAMKAIDEFKMDKFAIAGGVASNGVLREGMREACEKKGVQFYHPSPIFCTDNAAMIGVAAYYDFIHGQRDGLDLNAVPNLKLGER